jgi:8-oxo-dGTP pyrophosphatase MutT (NUDIX family)
MAAYDDVLARNIRAYRGRMDIGQERLAARMRALGFSAWLRQTVSKAEKNERRLTATEVVALAYCLETSIFALLAPTAQDKMVAFPSGAAVAAALMAGSVRGVPDESVAWKNDLPVIAGVSWPVGSDMSKISELEKFADEFRAWKAAVGGEHPEIVLPGSTVPVVQLPVVAAIVTSPHGVLIGRRNDGKPPWTFIAGEQEPDEFVRDTVEREVKEETGVEVAAQQIIGERDHPATGRHMIYVAATPTHETPLIVGDEAELAEVRWASLAEAEELMGGTMYPPVREYLARELGSGER